VIYNASFIDDDDEDDMNYRILAAQRWITAYTNFIGLQQLTDDC